MVKYLTKQEASLFLTNEMGLPVSIKTLSKLISVGGSPKYQKFGSRVVYQPENLIEWANSRLSAPLTSSSMEV